MSIDPENIEIPPGVGPHEGRELELMLKGEKPLAYFSDGIDTEYVFPTEDFRPHVEAGRIVMHAFEKPTRDGKHIIRSEFYALPTEAWRIDRAIELRSKICAGGYEEALPDDIEFGRLLGYSEEEIAVFVAHVKRMAQYWA